MLAAASASEARGLWKIRSGDLDGRRGACQNLARSRAAQGRESPKFTELSPGFMSARQIRLLYLLRAAACIAPGHFVSLPAFDRSGSFGVLL